MSKKRLITLILSIGIFLSLAATVFAAGQPRRYKENSTVKGTISQSFYQVNAKTDVTVKRITVTGTLYEKGTFGTFTASSWHRTVQTQAVGSPAGGAVHKSISAAQAGHSVL